MLLASLSNRGLCRQEARFTYICIPLAEMIHKFKSKSELNNFFELQVDKSSNKIQVSDFKE